MEINERHTVHKPLDDAERTQLRADFKAGKLAAIPPGKSLEYYREFNASGRAQVDGSAGNFVFVSLDGQQRLTDGEVVERLSCAWDDRQDVKTDLILPAPVQWADIPPNAVVFADGKAPSDQPLGTRSNLYLLSPESLTLAEGRGEAVAELQKRAANRDVEAFVMLAEFMMD